ncbi:MAG: hypothetical protein KGH54_03665 [Candidatus Micrarchaeota archaeon]|nr:hypothetical protein [Candidatus Micrarchaeota archaeon]
MAVFKEKRGAEKKDIHIIELSGAPDTERIYGALYSALKEGGEKGAFSNEVQVSQFVNTDSTIAGWHILENAPSFPAELAAIRKSYSERNRAVSGAAEAELIKKYSTPENLIGVVEVGKLSIRVKTYGLERGKTPAALLEDHLVEAGICARKDSYLQY